MCQVAPPKKGRARYGHAPCHCGGKSYPHLTALPSLLAEGKRAHYEMNPQSQRFWRRDGANLLSGGRLLARKQSPPAAGGDATQTGLFQTPSLNALLHLCQQDSSGGVRHKGSVSSPDCYCRKTEKSCSLMAQKRLCTRRWRHRNNAGEQRRKPIVMQAKDAVGSSVVESFSLKSANGAVSTTRACGFMTT